MSSPSTISHNEPNPGSKLGVYISLGSNLSYRDRSPLALLQGAIERIEAGGDKILATSSFFRSSAWPAGAGAPDFVNAVCRVSPSDVDPARLLERLHKIEAEFGRLRDPLNQWSGRTLDLDLLDYNGIITQNSSFPILPHPRIADRDFVLQPLLQLSPQWVHPITKKSGQMLMSELVMRNETNNCVELY